MSIDVGLAVIGDEVLLGEVADENISIISGELFLLGADLKYACVLPDDRGFMLEHLGWMKERYQWVITTGGIGATHDDITRQVISELTGIPLVVHQEAMDALEKRAGSPLPERLKPFAYFPEGASLIANPVTAAPGFMLQNLVVLPGIPALVRGMLPHLATVIEGKAAGRVQILTMKYESEIAGILTEAQEAYPDVKIGSYPVMNASDHKVRVVLRSREEKSLNIAEEYLKERIQ